MRAVDTSRINRGWKIAAIGVAIWGLLCLLVLNTYIVSKEVLLWMIPIWCVGILVVGLGMIVQGSVELSQKEIDVLYQPKINKK
jgi:hypothetical protein